MPTPETCPTCDIGDTVFTRLMFHGFSPRKTVWFRKGVGVTGVMVSLGVSPKAPGIVVVSLRSSAHWCECARIFDLHGNLLALRLKRSCSLFIFIRRISDSRLNVSRPGAYSK